MYFTFIARQQAGAEHEQWHASKAAASDAISAAGATITHHHAVGRDHAPWLRAEVGELGLAALRAVKAPGPRRRHEPGQAARIGAACGARTTQAPPVNMCPMSPTPTVCPRCSEPFECGIDTHACWCKDVTLDDTTRAAFAQYYEGCLCPECLGALESARPATPSVRTFLANQLRRRRA
jgi:hypothetical protein